MRTNPVLFNIEVLRILIVGFLHASCTNMQEAADRAVSMEYSPSLGQCNVISALVLVVSRC